MRIRLEPRKAPSRLALYGAPIMAIALTMLAGMVLFTLMGFRGGAAVFEIFIEPLLEPQRWPDIAVKASPLVMIATGLAIGFRANVWNIGAEGQYIVGAVAGTGVALATYEIESAWILPLMLLASLLGGAVWAAIPAILRVRLKVSEILTSLMLTYVALQLLYYLVRGPWRDPEGYNFPQTRMFSEAQTVPNLLEGTQLHWGVPLTFLVVLITWFVMSRTLLGYQVKVVGLAPMAARLGGFSENRTVLMTMLVSGALAGLAGMIECSATFGQLTPQFPVNYGFTAIIVAFLGRLHPVGVLIGGLALATSYIGADIAQTASALPQAATGLIQAMMLFFLLGVDIFVINRIRIAPCVPRLAS
ncbi:MAG: ABC transporter permease [Hyphomicrobiales bacterium]|nr:ABC transporter permease [Hyphomicrobiales bacterium]MBW0002293.1 ABC transporter permease [Hyphomicrobiales bacterium]